MSVLQGLANRLGRETTLEVVAVPQAVPQTTLDVSLAASPEQTAPGEGWGRVNLLDILPLITKVVVCRRCFCGCPCWRARHRY